MTGPSAHPQRDSLREFLNLYKIRFSVKSNNDLLRMLNVTVTEFQGKTFDGTTLKNRFRNLMSPPYSCAKQFIDLFILHTGNLPWFGDKEIEVSYRLLIAPLEKSYPLDAALLKYVRAEGDAGSFQEELLGTYLVYRASDEHSGKVVRSLLNVKAITGRVGMSYTFTRLHGTSAGYFAEGRIVVQSSRFLFLGASRTKDSKNEGGITLMSLGKMDMRTNDPTNVDTYRYLQGLHLMATDFTSREPVAMKVIALKDNELMGRALEELPSALCEPLSYAEAAAEISQATGYSEEQISSVGGPLSNELGSEEQLLSYSRKPPERNV
jgi:hypothetical protein